MSLHVDTLVVLGATWSYRRSWLRKSMATCRNSACYRLWQSTVLPSITDAANFDLDYVFKRDPAILHNVFPAFVWALGSEEGLFSDRIYTAGLWMEIIFPWDQTSLLTKLYYDCPYYCADDKNGIERLSTNVHRIHHDQCPLLVLWR